MTNEEYEQMINDAHSIPILEVGRLVVTNFIDKGHKSTGECCKHTDNKTGNFSFNLNDNYAKCFSCGTSFTTINLVKAYKGYSFKDSILFLYGNFPSYFKNTPYNNEYKYVKDDWSGLTNIEYMFLKIPTRISMDDSKISIREFAKLHPTEHDLLLLTTINHHKKDIENIYNSFLKNYKDENLEKIKKDRKEVYKKLVNFLNKGLMDKTYLKEKTKIKLDNLIDIVKEKQTISIKCRKNN